MSHDLQNIKSFSLFDGGRLIVGAMAVKDVATVEGSVLGGPNHLSRMKEVIPALTASLLDAGTAKRKKEGIRSALADRGISLSFSASGDRTYFSGQCLPEDLPFLFSTIAECLRYANFPESEVRNAKVRAIGNITEAKTDTRTQAGIALARSLYEPAHVNFSATLDEEMKEVRKMKRAQLSSFRNLLGKGGLVLAVTGDVKAATVHNTAERAFAVLERGTAVAPVKQSNKKKASSSEVHIPVDDKANIDVLLGAPLALRKLDPLYHASYVLAELLGGGFVSHLMQTIRERDGLTYGVYAMLDGLGDGADGFLKVWATFSPELYEKSVHALRKEIRIFFAEGLTAGPLEKKKEEIIGSYLVGLSTTRGLARALHQSAIDGRDFSYLAQYPALMNGVSLKDLHSAANLVPLEKFALAASGTFPKK